MTEKELLNNILNEVKKIVRDEVKTVRDEVKTVRDEVKTVRNEVKTIRGEVKTIDESVKSIEKQQQEDHLILKALEHSARINKAEHDKMDNDIAHIKGKSNNVDEKLEAIYDVIGRHEVDIKRLKNKIV